MKHLPYLLIGLLFGFVMVKSEAASWYRIQEMFRFESFHMYGIILSAVVTSFLATQLLQALAQGNPKRPAFRITPKQPGWQRYLMGGTLFGLGWGLAGACPGPMFALLGAGIFPMVVMLLFAVLGTYLYGKFQAQLPH